MEPLLKKYRDCFSSKDFIFSFALSLVLLTLSIVTEFYAAQYATLSASGSVTDIILSNTRVYDVGDFFVFGAMTMVLFIIIVCIVYPQRSPFILKSIALFVIIRAVFISLTHIGPFPTQVVFDRFTRHYAREIVGKNLFKAFFTGDDLFFSGHTGLPFLMAFIFWDTKWLRYIFIVFSIAFGITVLLGHLHYSIDVLAAFFITASIFNLAKIFFKHDHERALYTNTI